MKASSSQRKRGHALLEVWAIAVFGGAAASILASYLLGYLAVAQSPNTPPRFHLLAPPLEVTIDPAVANPAKDARVALYVSGAHEGDSLWIARSDARGLGDAHGATVTDAGGYYSEWVQLHLSYGAPLSGVQKFDVTDRATGSRGIAWLALPVSSP